MNIFNNDVYPLIHSFYRDTYIEGDKIKDYDLLLYLNNLRYYIEDDIIIPQTIQNLNKQFTMAS